MRPLEEKTYIAVPTFDGILARFKHGLTETTQTEMRERLSIAATFAKLAQYASDTYPKIPNGSDEVVTVGKANIVFHRSIDDPILSIHAPNPYEVIENDTLFLGWRTLSDPGSTFERLVRRQESSNDTCWNFELAAYTAAHRNNINGPLGTFYERSKTRFFLGFAIGGRIYPQSKDFLFHDEKLYVGGFDDVIREDISPFHSAGQAFLDSVNYDQHTPPQETR